MPEGTDSEVILSLRLSTGRDKVCPGMQLIAHV